MREPEPSVSIIVPAFHEAQNLAALTRRVFAAVDSAGIEAELIVMDDRSGDGSVEIVRQLAGEFPVQIIERDGPRGLAPAVLDGFEHARGVTLLVMDADLQHPPEKIPELVACLTSGEADFVIGSRYADGSIEGKWSIFRQFNSRFATWLAKPLTSVRDPMSGFFALHRTTWKNAARLDPIGYKIGLELLVKGRCRKPVEVPISFGARHAGESKLTLSEQLRYLRHLLRLYRFRLFDRSS